MFAALLAQRERDVLNFGLLCYLQIRGKIRMVEQMSEQTQHMSIKDIRNRPELVTDILLKKKDICVIFERRGDRVSYAYLKTYDQQSARILREAKEEHNALKEKGYTPEQAFEDFEQAREEMGKYL
jgi:hypothetical protein